MTHFSRLRLCAILCPWLSLRGACWKACFPVCPLLLLDAQISPQGTAEKPWCTAKKSSIILQYMTVLGVSGPEQPWILNGISSSQSSLSGKYTGRNYSKTAACCWNTFSYFNQPVHFAFVTKLMPFGKECRLCVSSVRYVFIGISVGQTGACVRPQHACVEGAVGMQLSERDTEGKGNLGRRIVFFFVVPHKCTCTNGTLESKQINVCFFRDKGDKMSLARSGSHKAHSTN